MAGMRNVKSRPNTQAWHTRELYSPEVHGHGDLAILLACEQRLSGARTICKARNLHDKHPGAWTQDEHGSLQDYGFSNLGVLLGCEQGLPESRTACELFGLHNKHPQDEICSRFILTKPIALRSEILETKTKPKPRSRFLELPVEIRLIIYEYAIPESWKFHPRNQGSDYMYPWSNQCESTAKDIEIERCLRLHGLRIQRNYLEPALLRTSTVIRNEAMEVFEKYLDKADLAPEPSSRRARILRPMMFCFWARYTHSGITVKYLERRRQMESLRC